MTLGTLAFGADAVSVRVGLIQLEDVAVQLGEQTEFTVAALSSPGIRLVIRLRFAERAKLIRRAETVLDSIAIESGGSLWSGDRPRSFFGRPPLPIA